MQPDEYDLAEAFRSIENELMASMIRNMDRHRAEETAEGYNWSMWQAEQLKALEKYKRKNWKKYQKQFKSINSQIEQLIRQARLKGGMKQELKILQAIRKGWKTHGTNGTPAHDAMTAEFFRQNDRKLDVLVEATMHDMEVAETAVLRKANDDYRKAIFNAQVYANSGAGTYEKAVDMATKDMLSRGLNCVMYANGARHTLADYADMAIRTASKRAYLQGEGEKRQEWGFATVIMAKRGNPCPKCLPFVGKVLIDDVWSGGSKDGVDPETGKRYPLMSYAISKGLYHPRCKDSHTTYFPGISTADDTWTKEELETIGQQSKDEARQQYVARQIQKYDRLAKYSLDADNKQTYSDKVAELKTVAKESEDDTMDLSLDDQRVILSYKSFESFTINDVLRRMTSMDDLTQEQKKFVSDLDNALNKVPTYEGTLIRTVDFSDYQDAADRELEFVSEFVPGKKIEIPQYWSTSKREGYNDDAKIRIYIEDSRKGRDISSIGLDESEVLYERKNKFTVIAKVFQDNMWQILLREERLWHTRIFTKD